MQNTEFLRKCFYCCVFSFSQGSDIQNKAWRLYLTFFFKQSTERDQNSKVKGMMWKARIIQFPCLPVNLLNSIPLHNPCPVLLLSLHLRTTLKTQQRAGQISITITAIPVRLAEILLLREDVEIMMVNCLLFFSFIPCFNYSVTFFWGVHSVRQQVKLQQRVECPLSVKDACMTLFYWGNN